MSDKSNELTFQNDIIKQLLAGGWMLGKPENYNRELAIYEEDLVGFVKDTQPKQWEKFCALYPNNAESKLLERVAAQLNKADPNAANNTDEQAMLGDFPKAIDDAILGSSEAHQNQMMQLLSDETKAQQFAKIIFGLLKLAS